LLSLRESAVMVCLPVLKRASTKTLPMWPVACVRPGQRWSRDWCVEQHLSGSLEEQQFSNSLRAFELKERNVWTYADDSNTLDVVVGGHDVQGWRYIEQRGPCDLRLILTLHDRYRWHAGPWSKFILLLSIKRIERRDRRSGPSPIGYRRVSACKRQSRPPSWQDRLALGVRGTESAFPGMHAIIWARGSTAVMGDRAVSDS
jgi:hypothetical protein